MKADFSAVVLAGGRSSRMGSDKLFLEWEGQTLLERAIVLAKRVADEVLISVSHPLQGVSPVVGQIVDLVPGQGPLMGLYTALRACRSPRALVFSPDLPFLPHELLLSIKKASTAFDVIVPRWGGRTEPLCGVYSKTVLSAIEACLNRGERSLHTLLQADGLSVAYLSERALCCWGNPARMFLNLNTPEDYRQAIKLLRARPSTAARPRCRADRVTLETVPPPEPGKENSDVGRPIWTID